MVFVAIGCIMCLGAVLAPGEAWAWGPGVHTVAARFVLANLDLLPHGVAAILAQHPQTYLYGCLSADFFVGKGTKNKPGHSHNWEAAARLIRVARTPQLAAHALGYASHLAADVVAHNFYVPGVMARMSGPATLSHVYVEVQADSRLTGGHGLGSRPSRPTQRLLDRNLAAALGKNAFATVCRKRVFSGSLSLSVLPGWNRSLRLAERLLPLPGGPASLEEMFSLSLRAVVDVLSRNLDSTLTGFDPVGSENLRLARRHHTVDLDERLLSLPGLPRAPFQEVA